jgi:hypothetical protein
MPRRVVLGVIVAALAVTSYGMFAPWFALPDFSRWKPESGVMDQVPAGCWVFVALAVANLGYGVLRRRDVRIAALVVACAATVGALAMGWVMRAVIASLAATPFGDRISVDVELGAWLVLVGFAVIAVAGMVLWRLPQPGVRASSPTS